jgi:hypothetical protein
MRSSFVLLLCLGLFFLQAQDTTKISFPFQYELQGLHIVESGDAKVFNQNITVPDNPLNHFAVYGGFILSPTYKEKYSIDLGLFFEERNHSGGNYTLGNIAIFPKITFRIKDKLKLGNSHLGVSFTGGDLWDENFNDILRIYNLDFNGFILKLNYHRFSLALYKISDLSFSVGLALDEMNKFSLEYENNNFFHAASVTINSRDFAREIDHNLTYFTRYSFSENSKIEGQIENRINPNLNSGIAFGVKYFQAFNMHRFGLRFQFYNAPFNFGYRNDNVSYGTDYFNFSGEQLYPLKNYYRPVNQWAFLTNYQSLDVYNVEFDYAVTRPLYKKLNFILSHYI